MIRLLLLLLLPMLSACATPHNPTTPSIVFDADLWRAARETVDFLPTGKANPMTGALETGWGEPHDATGNQVGVDRYKIVVRLDYAAAYDDAATVTVRHEIRSGDGWMQAKDDSEAAAALAKAIGNAAGDLRLKELRDGPNHSN